MIAAALFTVALSLMAMAVAVAAFAWICLHIWEQYLELNVRLVHIAPGLHRVLDHLDEAIGVLRHLAGTDDEDQEHAHDRPSRRSGKTH